MEKDDIVKYLPTSTVGKVVDMRTADGREWAKLDHTNLWYDVTQLTPCDPSEYKPVSVKYRESKIRSKDDLVSDLHREDATVNDMMIVG